MESGEIDRCPCLFALLAPLVFHCWTVCRRACICTHACVLLYCRLPRHLGLVCPFTLLCALPRLACAEFLITGCRSACSDTALTTSAVGLVPIDRASSFSRHSSTHRDVHETGSVRCCWLHMVSLCLHYCYVLACPRPSVFGLHCANICIANKHSRAAESLSQGGSALFVRHPGEAGQCCQGCSTWQTVALHGIGTCVAFAC